VEAEALLQIHPFFFSHSIKQRVLLFNSSHCLSASSAKDVWGQHTE